MGFTRKRTDYDEVYNLVHQLWPWEINHFYGMSLNSIRIWLNDKTGMDVPSSAPVGYSYWLPRLRELAESKR